MLEDETFTKLWYSMMMGKYEYHNLARRLNEKNYLMKIYSLKRVTLIHRLMFYFKWHFFTMGVKIGKLLHWSLQFENYFDHKIINLYLNLK
jgi:hypothetical protein